MKVKFVLLLIALLQLNVYSNEYKCAFPDQFEKAYSGLGGEPYKEAKKTSKIRLHQFLFYVGNPLTAGISKEVVEINYLNPKTTIRKVPLDGNRLVYIVREVGILKKMCGQDTEKYTTMFECKSPTIVSFYGCVEGVSSLSFLEEYMEQNLSSGNAVDRYSKLAKFKKVEAMLDIIDRFIELHRAGYVHGDVKLENIVTKGLEFSNFKITNLGFADKPGEAISGGTDGLFPPEIIRSASYERTVSYQQDIYALGMTFAYMNNGDFATTIGETMDLDEKSANFLTDWDKIVTEGLKKVFDKDDNLKSIRVVIEEAVKADTNNRFKTMEEFSNKLFNKYKDLKGADKVIKEIENSKTIFDATSATPSYWRSNIVQKAKTPQPYDDAAPIESPKPFVWTFGSSDTTANNGQNRVLI